MSSFSIKYILKPTIAGLTVSILDRYAIGETNPTRNAIFGASAALSIAAVSLTVPAFEKAFDSDSFSNSKSLSTRIYESAAGSAGAYLANKYIFDSNPFNTAPYKHIGVVIIGDILGETVSQLVQ